MEVRAEGDKKSEEVIRGSGEKERGVRSDTGGQNGEDVNVLYTVLAMAFCCPKHHLPGTYVDRCTALHAVHIARFRPCDRRTARLCIVYVLVADRN